MLPTLSDLGIQVTPAYIHKIDRRSSWTSTDDTDQRVSNAVARIFNNPENLYSFWRVESDLDFYCIAASLNSGRSSPSEEINFLWTTDEELNVLQLTPEQIEEGKCLYSKKLHYDILIQSAQAYQFCTNLMNMQRDVCRCKKPQMALIIDCLTEKKCQVYGSFSEACVCNIVLDKST